MIYEYDEPFCPLGMTGSLESLPPATLVELGLGLDLETWPMAGAAQHNDNHNECGTKVCVGKRECGISPTCYLSTV
jgi:hypothetical protein